MTKRKAKAATTAPPNLEERIGWRRVRLTLENVENAPPMLARGSAPADIVALMRAVIGPDPREHLLAVYLDATFRPLAVHTVAIGVVDSVPANPREIFAPALLLSAAYIVVGHNHPDGNSNPSRADFAGAERLRSAGALLGVELLDDVVLGADDWTSLRTGATYPYGTQRPENAEALSAIRWRLNPAE